MPLGRNATWHYDTQFLKNYTHKAVFKMHLERDWVEWKIMMSNCDWEKKRFFTPSSKRKKMIFCQ